LLTDFDDFNVPEFSGSTCQVQPILKELIFRLKKLKLFLNLTILLAKKIALSEVLRSNSSPIRVNTA